MENHGNSKDVVGTGLLIYLMKRKCHSSGIAASPPLVSKMGTFSLLSLEAQRQAEQCLLERKGHFLLTMFMPCSRSQSFHKETASSPRPPGLRSTKTPPDLLMGQISQGWPPRGEDPGRKRCLIPMQGKGLDGQCQACQRSLRQGRGKMGFPAPIPELAGAPHILSALPGGAGRQATTELSGKTYLGWYSSNLFV